MDINHSLRIRLNRIKKQAAFLKFSAGGKTLNDKIASFFLRTVMNNPFEPRSPTVKKRIEKKGNMIALKHSYFNNLKLLYDLNDNFEMAICREFFVEHTYDLNKIRFIPERIIDCGAYRGYFSFLAKKHFPKAIITAIEAHPANYKKIQESLVLNKIQSVELIHGAISKSRDEYIPLYFEGSSGSLENTFGKNGEYVQVKTIDLKEYTKHDRLLLKIDIEGAELDFFPRIVSSLPPICAIFIETHDHQKSIPIIKKAFKENGFSFEIIRERGQFIDSFAQKIS